VSDRHLTHVVSELAVSVHVCRCDFASDMYAQYAAVCMLPSPIPLGGDTESASQIPNTADMHDQNHTSLESRKCCRSLGRSHSRSAT